MRGLLAATSMSNEATEAVSQSDDNGISGNIPEQPLWGVSRGGESGRQAIHHAAGVQLGRSGCADTNAAAATRRATVRCRSRRPLDVHLPMHNVSNAVLITRRIAFFASKRQIVHVKTET